MMKKPNKTTVHVRGSSINVLTKRGEEYLCPTDTARFKYPDHPDDVICRFKLYPIKDFQWLSACAGKPARSGAQFTKNPLALARAGKHVPGNTRAVPLVRKNDAHQGRVSFLPKSEATRVGVGA